MSYREEYLEEYGHHFNKKMYEWAVKKMTDRNGNKVTPMEKEKVSDFLKNNGVTLTNDVGYDAPYVLMMKKADCWGSSLSDDPHLAKAVKDYLDDPDGNPCKAFDHYWIDSVAKDEPIFWEDFL